MGALFSQQDWHAAACAVVARALVARGDARGDSLFRKAQGAAQRVMDDEGRKQIMLRIARALVSSGRLSEASAALRSLPLDNFARTICLWEHELDRQQTGCAWSALTEIARIAGLLRADWASIHVALTAP